MKPGVRGRDPIMQQEPRFTQEDKQNWCHSSWLSHKWVHGIQEMDFITFKGIVLDTNHLFSN